MFLIISFNVINVFFNRKVVKKYKDEIPKSFRPSDIIEALQKCEADVLSKIEHENIIKYYAFFIENDHICVVLEACDMDLQQFLERHFKVKKNKTIDKDLALKWLKQLVAGLKYLHSKKCHHRDLKPL